MRIRHKQPTLVSMWMLDVFCCALGCVTLLFLLNSRMASDAANANRTALIDLQSLREKLAASITDLEATRVRLNAEEAGRQKLAAAVSDLDGLKLTLTAEVDNLTPRLSTTRTERDDLAKKLGTAQAEPEGRPDRAQRRGDRTQRGEGESRSRCQGTRRDPRKDDRCGRPAPQAAEGNRCAREEVDGDNRVIG